MIDPNWAHPAEVIRVIDGDTFVARLDLGMYWGGAKIEATGPIRIAGLWAPERRQPGGSLAAAVLAELLTRDRPDIVVRTRKPNPRDAYGRVVADVWAAGASVAALMIEAGHGTETKT